MTTPTPLPAKEPRSHSASRAGRDSSWRFAATRSREVWILLPAAVVLIAVVAVATLGAWRVALREQGEGRQREARRLAEGVAGRLIGATPSDLSLRQLAPAAHGIALVSESGQLLVATNPPTGALEPTVAAAEDPVAAAAGLVVGWAAASQGRWVRVELSDGGLRSQRRTIAVLGPLLLGVVLAASVLLILFLRQLLQPWQALLAQAAQATAEDQASWIAGAVDRALARHRGELDPDAGRAVAASVDTGLLVLAPDQGGSGLVLTASNPAAAELLAIEAPPFGLELEQALAARPELVTAIRELLASADPTELRDVALTGGATLGISAHRLARGEGGALVLLSDRTRARREQHETRLANALAELGELAAGVAHELRNGLAALSGRLALLDRRRDWAQLEPARVELVALERVVADFLAFARPGTARSECLDLAVLAQELAGERVVVQPTSGPLWIDGDRVLLDRALGNLVRNALEAQSINAGPIDAGPIDPGPGPVEVVCVDEGEQVGIDIRDRGPGVPQELRERLFRPFATARPGGVGLGLAVARRILDLHGGSIELRDRDRGGTVAAVRFPRTLGVSATISNTPSPPAAQSEIEGRASTDLTVAGADPAEPNSRRRET